MLFKLEASLFTTGPTHESLGQHYCKIVEAQIAKIDCENILVLRKINKLINRKEDDHNY